MDRDEFMELVYETFADEPDNVLANGIIEAADAYVEHEKAQLSQEGTTFAPNNQVNLCDSCTYTYPECPSEKGDVIFGTGIGNDNICACNKYQPVATVTNVGDTISRKAAIDCINGVEEVLRSLPTVQPETKEGHWILHETPDGDEQYECSECGVLWEFNDGTPDDNEAYFCPKCGTKMKGERRGEME